MAQRDNYIGIAMGLDVTDLKAGLTETAKAIQQAETKFKSASSGMDSWKDSAEGLKAELDYLGTKLTNQKKNVAGYEAEIAELTKKYGENSVQVEELKKKLVAEQQAVANTEKSIREKTSRLNMLEGAYVDTIHDADLLQASIKQLGGILRDQKKTVAQYEAQLARAKDEHGETSEEVKELEEKLEKAKSSVSKTEDALGKYEDQLEKVKSESDDATKSTDKLDDSLDEAEKSSKDAKEGFTIMKGALADLVASAVKGAIGAFKELAGAIKSAYEEYDEGQDNMIKATGATGKVAQELTESYENVASSIVGDFADIGSAIGEVNTRFGFTGEELEGCTTQFLKFAEITGTDATDAVKLVSRAMGDAGIDSSEYASVLDDLAIACQASGISVDTLTENLTKYGAPMRALGFDTKESIAIFASWEKAGVNTEIAFSGMKKAISNWSKEGKDSRKEFKKTLDEIKSCPDIASATTKAIEVFGAKAGPDLADAIQEGRFEYEDFLKILEGSEGTVNATFDETQDALDEVKVGIQTMKIEAAKMFGEMLEKYQPQIQKALKYVTEELLPKLINGIGTLIDNLHIVVPLIVGLAGAWAAWKIGSTIKDAVSGIKDMIKWTKTLDLKTKAHTLSVKAHTIAEKARTVATKLGTIAQKALNLVMSANPIVLVITAIVALIAIFVVLWKKCDWFREFWINLWESIKKYAKIALDAICGFFTKAWDWIKQAWSGVVEWFQNLWNGIKNVWSETTGWFDNLFTSSREKVQKAWSGVVDWFGQVWEGIKKVFSTVVEFYVNAYSKAWEGIKKAWSTVVKWFKDLWSKIQNAFKSVGTFFRDTFKKAWNNVKSAWSSAVSWFRNIWTSISNTFSSVSSWFKNKFQTAWNNVKNAWSSAGSWFKNIWQTISNAFSNVGSWFKSKFQSAWNNVKSVWSSAGTWFRNIWSKIKSAFSSVASTLGGYFRDAWSKVKSAFSGVSSWASGIVDKILSFFKSLPKKLKNIGKDMMDGLKNGIKEKISSVKKAITNAVDKVVGKFKDLLGIESPSKLMRDEVGAMMGLGVGEGITGSIKNVLKDAQKFTDAVSNGMLSKVSGINVGLTGSAGAIGGTIAGNGGTTVTNTFNQTINAPKSPNRYELYRDSKRLIAMRGAY